MSIIKFSISSVFLLLLTGCGINNIPTYDEQVKASWSQVENQYQRRFDLIPNLVNTVKGYATHEKDALTAVVEARAKVGSIHIDKGLINNPLQQQTFEQAQSKLSSVLSRLMVVVERYPELKSNQNFLALQSQLEGTENRISVARRDYTLAIERLNTELRTYPGRLWHSWLYSDMKIRKDYYKATAINAEQAPVVSF